MGFELYIHIPFCARKCNYCDFLSFPADREEMEQYCQSLQEEIKWTADAIQHEKGKENEKIMSIFMGGGTPSILTPKQIEGLFSCIRNNFYISDDAEISMEANPGTLTREKLYACLDAGVNRLSMGLQSSNDSLLKVLGRIHTWEQFLENYQEARRVGFHNMNIDIMSGLPGQSLADYMETLHRVTELEPEHISSYSLILEEGTPFYSSEKIRKQLPDETVDREMYEKTKQFLQEKGYERYEISNYAKEGFACRHNLGYWDEIPYLGVGLGASSYYKGARFSNEMSIKEYKKHPFIPFRERKDYFILNRKDKMEDYMIFGLRKMAGVSLSRFKREFAIPAERVYGEVFQKYRQQNLLAMDGDFLRLTDAGIDVSNRIFEDFLLETIPEF